MSVEATKLYRDTAPIPDKDRITCKAIQNAVAKAFGVALVDLLSRSRMSEVAKARQTSVYLTREATSMSLITIAKMHGLRDHAAVRHAHVRAQTRFLEDSAYRSHVIRSLDELEGTLRQ